MIEMQQLFLYEDNSKESIRTLDTLCEMGILKTIKQFHKKYYTHSLQRSFSNLENDAIAKVDEYTDERKLVWLVSNPADRIQHLIDKNKNDQVKLSLL